MNIFYYDEYYNTSQQKVPKQLHAQSTVPLGCEILCNTWLPNIMVTGKYA